MAKDYGPQIIIIPRADFDRFIDACENPKPPTRELIELVREYGRFVGLEKAGTGKTSEMITRVAKAMAAKCKCSHDWGFWLDEARAAIEAMREPTEAMNETGFATACEHDNNGSIAPSLEIAPATFKAMIDEALK